MFYITGLYRQWSDGQGVVVVTPAATPDAGHGRRRKKRRYILDDGRHVLMTDDALRAYLRKRVVAKPAPSIRQPEAAPVAKESAAKGEAASGLLSRDQRPTYPAAPNFDQLWAETWVRRQPEVMAALREVAQALEAAAIAADDEDVEILLLA